MEVHLQQTDDNCIGKSSDTNGVVVGGVRSDARLNWRLGRRDDASVGKGSGAFSADLVLRGGAARLEAWHRACAVRGHTRPRFPVLEALKHAQLEDILSRASDAQA